jgi:hypothetical protein
MILIKENTKSENIVAAFFNQLQGTTKTIASGYTHHVDKWLAPPIGCFQ